MLHPCVEFLAKPALGLLSAAVVAAPLFAGPVLAETATWDMALPWGQKEFHTKNAQRFAEEVKTVTDGRVEIVVHPGGALGIKGPETVRSVRDGMVPMAEGVMLQTVGEAPINGVESLPYLIGDAADLRKLHDIAQPDFRKALEQHNLKVLYFVPWPANQIYSSKPIAAPDDFKGLKIRTTDPNSSAFFKGLGATPVQMPIADVLPALASGALDATMTSMTTAADQKYWEFMKYGYLTRHLWATNAMLVNKDSWDAISAEDQAAIAALAAELEPQFWAISAAEDDKAIKKLRDGGMIVEAPDPAVAAAMRAAAKPVWDEVLARVGGRAPVIVEEYLAATGKSN
ncbi:MAG: TRAP transporter substrate-binding protein [Sneathiellaceae bacterium]